MCPETPLGLNLTRFSISFRWFAKAQQHLIPYRNNSNWRHKNINMECPRIYIRVAKQQHKIIIFLEADFGTRNKFSISEGPKLGTSRAPALRIPTDLHGGIRPLRGFRNQFKCGAIFGSCLILILRAIRRSRNQ